MAQTPPAGPSNSAPGRPSSNQPHKRPDALAPMRSLRFWVILAILFILNIVISNVLFSAGQTPTITISYNSFLDQVDTGNVSSVTSTGESIIGTAKKAIKDSSGTSSTRFQTQRPSFATDDLEGALRQ